MRIILLIQKPQARGAELFACNLGEDLLKKGHQVILISLFGGNFRLPFSGQQIHLQRRPIHRLWDFSAWSALNQEIRRWKPDIVQAMGGDTLKFMILSKRFFGWKSKTIFFNGSLVSSYIHSSWVKAFNVFLFKQLDAVVAVSQASKGDLEKVFPFEITQEIIPVGVVQPRTSNIKPSVDPILVHVGGFSFEKNHEGLLRIFAKVLEKNPLTKLILIGDGPLKKTVEDKAVSMGINASILWKGALEHPFEVIPPNAVLVLPSSIEGLPAVILEAFLVGIPVVAYDVGAVSELIGTDQRGWLIELGSEVKFVESLVNIQGLDLEKIRKILEIARDFAEENFLISKVGDLYEEFYFRLVYAP